MIQSKKETKLKEGIINGDERILKTFYKRSYPFVKKYVLQNSGNIQDAEDVWQDSMLVLYQKLREKTIEIRSTIQTYFYGICKNVWKVTWRMQNRWVLIEDFSTYVPETDTLVSEQIEAQEREWLFKKYYQELNEGSKKLLQLFFEGRSMRDIAMIVGYTEGYTRKKKYRIKKYVTERIQKDPAYKELGVSW